MLSFGGSVGVEHHFLQLKATLNKWWNANGYVKLKPLLRVVPLFICWQVWQVRKRTNDIKFGVSMSYLGTRGGIAHNLILLSKQLYPWMHNLPTNRPELVRYLTEYIPRIGCKVVYWKFPRQNSFKCTRNHNLFPLILETDSLAAMNMVEGAGADRGR
uniref:RNase H type-1 domain-containing protein n=1 Tax=Solanum lycopersicum TaxID=4081 RepID=A0A3Q7J6N2_SOLLC